MGFYERSEGILIWGLAVQKQGYSKNVMRNVWIKLAKKLAIFMKTGDT